MQVMNQVDILDLVKIDVHKTMPTPNDPAPIRVSIEALDKNKNVVFDADALRVFNRRISEEVIKRELDIKDPVTFRYIEELVGRMLSELYKNGLVALDDVSDAPEDPYKDVRNQYN